MYNGQPGVNQHAALSVLELVWSLNAIDYSGPCTCRVLTRQTRATRRWCGSLQRMENSSDVYEHRRVFRLIWCLLRWVGVSSHEDFKVAVNELVKYHEKHDVVDVNYVMKVLEGLRSRLSGPDYVDQDTTKLDVAMTCMRWLLKRTTMDDAKVASCLRYLISNDDYKSDIEQKTSNQAGGLSDSTLMTYRYFMRHTKNSQDQSVRSFACNILEPAIDRAARSRNNTQLVRSPACGAESGVPSLSSEDPRRTTSSGPGESGPQTPRDSAEPTLCLSPLSPNNTSSTAPAPPVLPNSKRKLFSE